MGSVGMHPKGAYDKSVTYSKLQLVTYRNNTYLSKKDGNIGHEPVGEDEWWSLIVDAQTAYDGATSATAAAKRANDAADNAERINAEVQEAEYQRIANEQERTTAETTRDMAEQARQGDENLRKTAEENRVSAETGRSDAEQRRDANETSRESAEQMRKSDEADRIRDEKEREAAETSRKAAEKLRDTAENDRNDAEQERRQHEDARADAEGKRDTAETLRKQAETGRDNAETERTTAEQTRKDSEASRVDAEQERTASEQTRQENETARVTAETERGNKETERIASETERKSAEQERKTAETGREDAEAGRVLAETSRQIAEAKREQAAKENKAANDAAVADAEAATEAANTATGKANTAASNADTATANANAAAAAAEKVNAVLGDDNVLKVTDRTGAEKSLDLVSQAAATEMAKKVEQNAADIAELKEGVKDYYVGENDEVTGDPHFKNCKGNKEFLGEWHPFLIDHTDNTGEATHPVGQLMDNNHFRFVSGAFAPTVGITEAMRAACDVQLYTDAEHTTPLTLKNGVVVTDKAGAHPYDAVEVYNSLGLVDLYDGEGNKVRQLLPWETTETKYSVMIGRYDTIYPVDRQTGDSGKVLSGIFKRQVRYDGIDTGKYPLLGTALAPCPVTTVGNKTRNFFYAYAVGDTNTTNGASGAGESMCSMYVNDGRTYPRISDISQVTNMQKARANNADTNASLPFAEGGYHGINTFILCMELLYGTKYLHDNNLFGSGISSNDACNSENTWLDNGGVRCKEQGTEEWTYSRFGDRIPFGYNEKLEKNNFSWFVNYYRPKEQCMESQMAASWAAEFGIAENTEYEAYGGTYRYKNITGVKGLADGVMNCKVYRKKIGTCKGYKDADTLATYDLELSLRMSLMHGMNVSGDVFAYWGGGCEMVGTNKGSTDSARLEKNYIDFYLEPNQSKWVNESVVSKNNLGTFGFEAVYSKIGVFGPPILSDGYCKNRLGYTPYKIADGGNMSSWQCFYSWAFPYWSSTLNQRVRIAVRLRGSASLALCSARFLNADHSAASTNVYYGGSAQCRIVQ